MLAFWTAACLWALCTAASHLHNANATVLCCGELGLVKLATLHAENTPSFSSFFARGKARTWAFFWLARCCWLRPGLAGSLLPGPDAVAAAVDPAEPAVWAWRSRGCKACVAGSDMSTLQLLCSLLLTLLQWGVHVLSVMEVFTSWTDVHRKRQELTQTLQKDNLRV